MSLPYFRMYPTDFEADTSHLSLEEDGAYNRLLRIMWMTPGCSIPDDKEWITRRLRIDSDTYDRVVAPLISEFLTHEKSRFFSPRLKEEFEKTKRTYERRAEAGAKGGKTPKSLKNNDKKAKIERTAKSLKNNDKMLSIACDLLDTSNMQNSHCEAENEGGPANTLKNNEIDASRAKAGLKPGLHNQNQNQYIYNESNDSLLSFGEARAAFEMFVEFAKKNGLPVPVKLSDARKRKLIARLKDCDGLDGWSAVLARADGNPFLCGDNSSGWRADFDFFLQEKSFGRLMEGSYDRKRGAAGVEKKTLTDALDDVFSRMDQNADGSTKSSEGVGDAVLGLPSARTR